MRCALCVPPVKHLSSRLAIPPQVPLGHILVGSELLRSGHEVHLIDADAEKLSLRDTICRIKEVSPGCLLLGHPASTIGHNSALAVAEGFPHIPVIYGGAFPTYNAESIFAEGCGGIDFVVSHEAEKVTTELVHAIEQREPTHLIPGVLNKIHGGSSLTPVAPRPVENDLDAIRPNWNHEWGLGSYRAFGLPSTVVQFSRGCPRKCSYCGQWDFWKRWRRRSIASFVEEIEGLSDQGIRLFWIADENWSVDRDLFLKLLDSLKAVNRSHHLIVAMECAHVIRDMQDFKLYSEAGISMVMLGLDNSDSNSVNPSEKKVQWKELGQAIEALREVGIISIVNRFTGGESRAFRDRDLTGISPDFYNFLYPTPHNWTRFGTENKELITERDLTRWDYRHPVIGNSDADLILQRYCTKGREVRHNLKAAVKRLIGCQPQTNVLIRKSTFLVTGVFLLELWLLLRASAIHVTMNMRKAFQGSWSRCWLEIRKLTKTAP